MAFSLTQIYLFFNLHWNTIRFGKITQYFAKAVGKGYVYTSTLNSSMRYYLLKYSNIYFRIYIYPNKSTYVNDRHTYLR